jgi:hypothetical protein
MQQLILDIDESRYSLLLQFLKTLDYVKVVQPPSNSISSPSEKKVLPTDDQLALLQQVLQKQTKSLFKNIADPVAWQKQQRDEWS